MTMTTHVQLSSTDSLLSLLWKNRLLRDDLMIMPIQFSRNHKNVSSYFSKFPLRLPLSLFIFDGSIRFFNSN